MRDQRMCMRVACLSGPSALRDPLATRGKKKVVELSVECQIHSRVPDVEILEPRSKGFVGKESKSVGVRASSRESPWPEDPGPVSRFRGSTTSSTSHHPT